VTAACCLDDREVTPRRGPGLCAAQKVRAYQLQELIHDTLQANLELGLPADARDYSAAAASSA